MAYIPISASANYHFKMENKKFDPFVGAGLGFHIVSEPSGYTVRHTTPASTSSG